MSDIVEFSDIETPSGLRVGHARLNQERTLNSLSLEMVRLLRPKLDEWASADDVAAVLISGAGDKAFCAGGDIQALYHAIVANKEAGEVVNDYPFAFFEEEYRLDFALHTFHKPVMTIGHGIVMGGGMGLFGASSHCVLTETSRLAFPEITIGLFPDAGGTWSLGHMAPHWASFLGLTGSHVNAADALACGWGTHVVPQAERGSLVDGLAEVPFSSDANENHTLLNEYLDGYAAPALPQAELVQVPEREIDVQDWQREVASVHALAGTSTWIDRGLGNLTRGCPTTAGIVLEQLRRVPDLSLADAFRLELTVASHCAHGNDFQEGVRALLIEKDNAPAWHGGRLDTLDPAHVRNHFEPLWPEHPLADL